MSSSTVRRRLARLSERLSAAREELLVVDEQIAFLDSESSDASVRALVSENPLDRRAADEARRALDSAGRHRARLAGEIERVSAQMDCILDSRALKEPT